MKLIVVFIISILIWVCGAILGTGIRDMRDKKIKTGIPYSLIGLGGVVGLYFWGSGLENPIHPIVFVIIMVWGFIDLFRHSKRKREAVLESK